MGDVYPLYVLVFKVVNVLCSIFGKGFFILLNNSFMCAYA